MKIKKSHKIGIAIATGIVIISATVAIAAKPVMVNRVIKKTGLSKDQVKALNFKQMYEIQKGKPFLK